MYFAARLTLTFALLTGNAFAQDTFPVNLTGAISAPDVLPPAVYSFAVPEDGDYAIRVVDFGVDDPNVPPAASIDLLIVRTGGSVPALTADHELDTTQALTAGNYTLVLIVDPEETIGVASIAVVIEPTDGGDPILDEVAGFADSSLVENPTVIEFSFTATSSGGHDLIVSDLQFVNTLSALQTLAVRRSDGAVLGMLLTPGTASLSLTVGDEVDVTIIATRAADNDRGLVSYSVTDTVADELVAESVEPLGDFSDVQLRSFDSLTAGVPLNLTITDLEEPAPLTGLTTIALSGTNAAGSIIAGKGAATVTPEGTSLTVYLAATSASTGNASLVLDDGADTIADTVVGIVPGDLQGRVSVIEASFDVPTDGEVGIDVADFIFPSPLTSVTAAVIFNGEVVASLDVAGTTSFEASAGEHLLSVVGTAAAGSVGAFGVTTSQGDAMLVEETAAAGNPTLSTGFTVASAQELRVVVTDLAFPERFGELRAVIAQGATLFGTILGGSLFEFDAAAGDYELLVLAEPGAVTGYAVGSANIDTAPEAPTVALSASATSVTVGNGVTLTWSSTDATQCTASGSWSGAREASGSEEIASLQSDATYRLTCVGAGGSAAGSVTVRVVAEPAPSSGSGALSWPLLGLLMLIALIKRGGETVWQNVNRCLRSMRRLHPLR